MPRLEDKFDDVNRPATRILTADGVELYRVSDQYRIPLKFSEIPIHVRQAFLAAEDKRFYEHNGIDGQGLMRAFFQLFKNGKVGGGGSTITMQLAKRLYNGPEKSFQRKMDDIAFAFEIERTVANKNRILELYMNQVYFGERAYGIGAAARVYLNKSVKELTISDAALLARCVRIPNRQNPIRDLKVSVENRDVVLGVMREEHMITEDEYQKALEEQPKINKHPPRTSAIFTAGYGYHFVQHVWKTLDSDNFGVDLRGGGYTIYTTIDSRLQRLAERTTKEVILANRRNKLNEGAFVAIDRDGRILCEVGGINFHRSQLNIITQGALQPGSGFKPFVYSTALKEGVLHPFDNISNAPIHYKVGEGKYWDPVNASPRENQPSYSLQMALALSVNRPAIATILKVGPEAVVQYAHDFFGFRSKLDAVPSLALGTSLVNPLEMAQGYSVFMLHGDRVTPYPISKIVSNDGSILKEYQPEKAIGVFDPGIAEEMDGLLRGVVQYGTGRPALDIPNARGKTGTTNKAKDAWFTGYTDGVLGVSWVGNQRLIHGVWTQLPMGDRVFGGNTAINIWQGVMREARVRFGHPDELEQPAKASADKPEKQTKTDVPADGFDGTTSGDPSETPGDTTGNGETLPTVGKDPNANEGQKNIIPKQRKKLGSDEKGGNQTDTVARSHDLSPSHGPVARSDASPKIGKEAKTVSVEVCADTGDLASPYCPETVARTFLKGEEPKHRCKVHKP